MIQVLITHNLQIGVLDIPPPILSRVYQTLSRGFVNLLNAVKITDTNFPFPWAQLIYLLLVVHSMFTPLIVTSFTSSYQWAIPVTFLPVFSMFALNQVAAQLEKPFGTDDNDLPLTFFQTEFNQSLLLLMHEMADHLPSTLPNSKTSVDDLRRSSMARSDSKAEIVDIVTMCKESLMILSQSLPAALQQHCEAIDKFREAVPQLLSPPRVSEVSEVSNEGIRSV